MSGQFGSEDLGGGAAGAESGRNRGQPSHREHGRGHDGEKLPVGRVVPVADRGPEAEPSRQAQEGAGEGREHLRGREAGADLSRRSLTIHSFGRSSSAHMPPTSAGRPAAGARFPPTTTAASDRSGSAIAARWASRKRRSSSRRWASTMLSGSASPAAAAATSLRWNSARSGLGQPTSASHSVTRCWPSGVSPYTLRSGRSANPLDRSEVTRPAFQPSQGDVNLAGVHRLPDRAKRMPQPRPKLIAVRGLLGQHGQHHFLLHGPPIERLGITLTVEALGGRRRPWRAAGPLPSLGGLPRQIITAGCEGPRTNERRACALDCRQLGSNIHSRGTPLSLVRPSDSGDGCDVRRTCGTRRWDAAVRQVLRSIAAHG